MEFILDSRERGRSFTEVSWGGMEDGGVEEVGGGWEDNEDSMDRGGLKGAEGAEGSELDGLDGIGADKGIELGSLEGWNGSGIDYR